MYTIIIKNITVVDGSGNLPYLSDVAIQGDQVAKIAQNITTQAEKIIDGTGKHLLPGFIDIQNHSDSYWQIFDNPTFESLITQGFTTIITGNCGASLAPLLSQDSLLSIQKWHSLDATNINWQSFSEYVEELSRSRFACNIGTLVGYSTLRRGVVGDQIRRLEKEETRMLEHVLQQSLEAGAFGLSSGLSYAHEIIISELELFGLAKIVAKNNALLSIHMRSEGGEVIEALDEALDIARTTEVNLKISHLKIRNSVNWPKFPELVEQLDTAFHRGVHVHFDIYPYDTMWQTLYSYLPKWAVEGGRTTMLRHLADPVQKNKILISLNNSDIHFPSMIVASTANKLNFVGKTISQIAKNLETSSEQAVIHIIENGGSEVMVFEQNLNPAHVKELMMHPLSFIATDGGGFGLDTANQLVHPRCFGTATKYLRSALDLGIPIEQNIKKLTSGPAKKIGLQRRGEIKIDTFADLVVADLDKVKDQATYQNPYQFSLGISHVLVNGKLVVENGQVTKQLPGYVLRKK